MDFLKKVSKVEKKKVIPFWSFIFPETYICYTLILHIFVTANYSDGCMIYEVFWGGVPKKIVSLKGISFKTQEQIMMTVL